jgi:hypothetical protein
VELALLPMAAKLFGACSLATVLPMLTFIAKGLAVHSVHCARTHRMKSATPTMTKSAGVDSGEEMLALSQYQMIKDIPQLST